MVNYKSKQEAYAYGRLSAFAEIRAMMDEIDRSPRGLVLQKAIAFKKFIQKESEAKQ